MRTNQEANVGECVVAASSGVSKLLRFKKKQCVIVDVADSVAFIFFSEKVFLLFDKAACGRMLCASVHQRKGGGKKKRWHVSERAGTHATALASPYTAASASGRTAENPPKTFHPCFSVMSHSDLSGNDASGALHCQ